MDGSSSTLIVIALIYCAIYFLDTIFKSCSHHPYLYLLKNTGLEFQLFRFTWFTTAFNRTVFKWTQNRSSSLLHAWFSLGTWISLTLFPVAIYLIAKSSYQGAQHLFHRQLSRDQDEVMPQLVLQTMIPGINLPLEDLHYYTASLVVSSSLHELGHAVAAIKENVHMFGVGLSMVFIMPLAYVHISSEQLESLTPARQLRVLCAGIWHNIVLALISGCLVFLLPYLCLPLYDVSHGVFVQDILPGSPVAGVTGLQLQDVVTAFNDCPIADVQDWTRCTVNSMKQPNAGYCLASEKLAKFSFNNLDGECCNVTTQESHLCFHSFTSQTCLPARWVLENSLLACKHSTDCPSSSQCVLPALGNNTKLLSISRVEVNPVLFLGSPGEIYRTVQVTDYVPRNRFLPSTLPDIVNKMLGYVATFSAGLAIINVIPCFYLDGQFIVLAIVNLVFVNWTNKSQRLVANWITILGTALFLGSLVLIMLCSFFI